MSISCTADIFAVPSSYMLCANSCFCLNSSARFNSIVLFILVGTSSFGASSTSYTTHFELHLQIPYSSLWKQFSRHFTPSMYGCSILLFIGSSSFFSGGMSFSNITHLSFMSSGMKSSFSKDFARDLTSDMEYISMSPSIL